MGKKKKTQTGKEDVILKSFWRDNARFADLFNATVFEGKQVLQPDILTEMDTDVSGTIQTANNDYISLNRNRDVMKKTAMGVEFAIVAVENQMKVHYGAPLRTMLYDGLGYQKEYEEIRNQRKAELAQKQEKKTEELSETNVTIGENEGLSGKIATDGENEETYKKIATDGANEGLSKKIVSDSEKEKAVKNSYQLSGDEFLSGIRKEDRLHPIITIVISYSENAWDGPLCLKDMIVEMPEEIERVFSDYKMNLVQIRDSKQYVFQNEDVKDLFEISRSIYEKDFDQLKKNYSDRNINKEMIKLVGKITGSRKLESLSKEEKEEVEGRKMCRALEELVEEGYKAGIREKEQVEQLFLELSKAGRTEDIARAVTDKEYQKRLMEEYGIIK